MSTLVRGSAMMDAIVVHIIRGGLTLVCTARRRGRRLSIAAINKAMLVELIACRGTLFRSPAIAHAVVINLSRVILT